MADFLVPKHRQALDALLAGAVCSAPRGNAAYTVLLHACGAGGELLTGWLPLEVKACDSPKEGLTYLVIQDARVPAHMESRLSNLLLYTSACARAGRRRCGRAMRALTAMRLPGPPTGHDLRTPVTSIQAAAALLQAHPAVSADLTASSLLRTVDSACTVLLNCVTNLLAVNALQPAREAAEAARGARVRGRSRLFDPAAEVARVLDVVRNLDTVPPRLVLLTDPAAPLPPVVFGDDAALAAVLLDMTLSAMRIGAWTGHVPVRLRIAAQLHAHRPMHAPGTVKLTITTKQGEQGEQGSSGGTAAAAPGASPEAQQEAAPPAGVDLYLHAVAESPGRPLTALEVSEMMAPLGLFPADKGGATGLPLQVARALARANGGDLDIYAAGGASTVMALSFGLMVPAGPPLSPPPLGAAHAMTEALLPAVWPDDLPLPNAALPPVRAHEALPPEPLLKHAMFDKLLENCDDVFAVCSIALPPGCDMRVTYVSPSLGWRMGMDPAAALGRTVEELCHLDDRDGFHAELARARASPDGQLSCTHRARRADGTLLWCRTVGVFTERDLFLVCRDVRPTKSAELALRAFTLAASNELREPCNTIIVALAVLARRPSVTDAGEPPTGEPPWADAAIGARELTAAMAASAQLLEGIISNVVTVPQLEAGTLALQLSVFSPTALVDGVVRVCRMAATSGAQLQGCCSGIEVQPEPPPGLAPLPPLLEADHDRVAQVLQNLVTNACKFSDGKPVEVRAGMAAPAAAGAPPTLELAVVDHGRGMTAAEAAACFRAGAAAPSTCGGGTGLGLTISLLFAELMGGSVTVDSTPGLGSTFTLRLPARVPTPGDSAAALALEAAMARSAAEAATATAQEEEIRSLAAAAAADEVTAAARAAAAKATSSPPAAAMSVAAPGAPRLLRILVADDHALNLVLVTRLLRLHGFDVTAVSDGGAALAALQAAPTPPYDLWCAPVQSKCGAPG